MKLSDLPPGAIVPSDDPIEINAGLPPDELRITNDGDVPIHLTAHMHVFEANPMLRFDRRRAFGMRPDLPAGHAIRIEAGATTTVGVVPIGGARIIRGFGGLVDGPLEDADVDTLLKRAIERGYRHQDER